MIDVVAPPGFVETVRSLAETQGVECWEDAAGPDERPTVHLLVSAEQSQAVLDGLQSILSGTDQARIVVSGVETTLPRLEAEETGRPEKGQGTAASREELLSDLQKGCRLNPDFFVLVFLSATVAAVGLVKDNVAVVIGAMVIAPLLGPNLALALGTALGDRDLMWRSVRTNAAGLGVTLLFSMAVGWLWPVDTLSRELLARTDVGLDSVALAVASGAAAVLSLTAGLSSVLVGVMVAVALMPPAVTAGLLLSYGHIDLALGALLLLAVNVVCLNFAANLVFFAKGIGPRTWREKKQARYAMLAAIAFWTILLVLLLLAV